MLSVVALAGLVSAAIVPAMSTIEKRTASGTIVNLRIEGATDTIYEAPIFTYPHNVTTPSGGDHHCNGLNYNYNTVPGPTCTTALADAAKLKHFPFDGTWDPTYDDFFITSIGDSANTDSEFWGLLLEYQFTPVGGCQQEVTAGQHVLWAFNAFSVTYFLKAKGPATAKKGHVVTYTVTDGTTGVAIAGASIFGVLTDSDGHASVTFEAAGVKSGKATRDDSIRSNAVVTLVV